jgi:hypothetical protein
VPFNPNWSQVWIALSEIEPFAAEFGELRLLN